MPSLSKAIDARGASTGFSPNGGNRSISIGDEDRAFAEAFGRHRMTEGRAPAPPRSWSIRPALVQLRAARADHQRVGAKARHRGSGRGWTSGRPSRARAPGAAGARARSLVVQVEVRHRLVEQQQRRIPRQQRRQRTRWRSPPDSVVTSWSPARPGHALQRGVRDAAVVPALSQAQRPRCGWRPSSTTSVTLALRHRAAPAAAGRAGAPARPPASRPAPCPSGTMACRRAARSPASVCSSVVLPQPLGPSTHHSSPRCTCRSRASISDARSGHHLQAFRVEQRRSSPPRARAAAGR